MKSVGPEVMPDLVSSSDCSGFVFKFLHQTRLKEYKTVFLRLLFWGSGRIEYVSGRRFVLMEKDDVLSTATVSLVLYSTEANVGHWGYGRGQVGTYTDLSHGVYG